MTDENSPAPSRARNGWTVAAFCIFLLATASLHGEVWRTGVDSVVPANAPHGRAALQIFDADTTYHSWLVARQARTLLRRPHRLFDTEHCAPAPSSMVYSEPMITLGLLAIPFALATGEPVATYNGVLIVLRLWMALVMYWVVTHCSGFAP